jgi:hypothetical protein
MLYRAFAHIISDTPLIAILSEAKVSIKHLNTFLYILDYIKQLIIKRCHTNFAALTYSSGLLIHVEQGYSGQTFIVQSPASLIWDIDR